MRGLLVLISSRVQNIYVRGYNGSRGKDSCCFLGQPLCPCTTGKLKKSSGTRNTMVSICLSFGMNRLDGRLWSQKGTLWPGWPSAWTRAIRLLQINSYLKPRCILSHTDLCFRLSLRLFKVRRPDSKSFSQQVNWRHQELDAEGKPHPSCNSLWIRFVTFSSIGLWGQVRISNPIDTAVLAPSAWTISRSQANTSPTMLGLSLPNQSTRS